MEIGIFIIFSIIYSAACAILDGLANRLIFRQNRKLSYFHHTKRLIYKLSEWTGFCMILLIFFGLVAPIVASFAIGGWQYVYLYLTVFCFVHWDMIFGKLVFDDWLGDLPSIRLPFLGWMHVPLWQTTLVRFILGCIFLYLYLHPTFQVGL